MYIVKCADGSYYTGSTKDLKRRLWQHQNGEGANFTKKHRPVKLVYFEEYTRIDHAFNREKQVQGWSRAKKEALIEGKFKTLPELAVCNNYTRTQYMVLGHCYLGHCRLGTKKVIERSRNDLQHDQAAGRFDFAQRPFRVKEKGH